MSSRLPRLPTISRLALSSAARTSACARSRPSSASIARTSGTCASTARVMRSKGVSFVAMLACLSVRIAAVEPYVDLVADREHRVARRSVFGPLEMLEQQRDIARQLLQLREVGPVIQLTLADL